MYSVVFTVTIGSMGSKIKKGAYQQRGSERRGWWEVHQCDPVEAAWVTPPQPLSLQTGLGCSLASAPAHIYNSSMTPGLDQLTMCVHEDRRGIIL
jgi:hypothetical protein